MLKTFLCSLLALLSIDVIQAQDSVTLSINVTNIQHVQGQLMTCLVSDKSEYLSNCKNGQNTQVNAATMLITFENVMPGTYCVTMFHDKDNNGKLNTGGLFGMPSEPYGFSNNAKALFGPPKYKKCTFELEDDKEITIKL